MGDGGNHWKDVIVKKNEDKDKIHGLRLNFYIKEEEDLINRKFSVAVLHLKGRNIFGLMGRTILLRRGGIQSNWTTSI